jgi:hypothetical protein
MDKVEKYLGEASSIHWTKLEKEKQELMKKIIPHPEKMTYWDGIHGTIVDLNSGVYGNIIRFNKKDLKKILNNNVRWIDVKSIGF